MSELVGELHQGLSDFAEDLRWWLGLAWLAALCFALWFILGGPLDMLEGPEDHRESS